MPDCPHCHGYYFGNPDQCPKCHFDFKKQETEEQERAKQEAAARASERALALLNNPRYEYTTATWFDAASETEALTSVLSKYAEQGWRLHSVIQKEGVRTASPTFGLSTSSLNQTILIFERCIKLPGQ